MRGKTLERRLSVRQSEVWCFDSFCMSVVRTSRECGTVVWTCKRQHQLEIWCWLSVLTLLWLTVGVRPHSRSGPYISPCLTVGVRTHGCGFAVSDRRGQHMQPLGSLHSAMSDIGVSTLRCGNAFTDHRGQYMQPLVFLHVAVIDRRGQCTQPIRLRALGDSTLGSFSLRFVSSLA